MAQTHVHHRPLTKDAFLYSPAFAQLVWPAAQLSWPVFALLFVTIDAALLAWLLRPLRWWALPIAIVLTPEILGGNIFIPLAAMAVLGFRYPGAWAFSTLTKVAPTVMPLWWLVRREWRPLCFWGGTTAAVVIISFALGPSLWVQWAMHMATWATESDRRLGAPLIPPLLYRAPVGVALLLVGARKGWRWTVPVAALCCTPVVWLGSYAWLTAIPRIQSGDGTHPSAVGQEQELEAPGVPRT